MNWTLWDWLQYLLNFGLVIALLLASLWVLRRIQSKQLVLNRKNGGRLRVIESISVGPRQKLMLVAIDDRELLIGTTTQQISALNTPTGKVSELV